MTFVRTVCLTASLALWGAGAASALDLEGVLREVAAANPTLAARRSMVEAASRRVAPAGAWRSPMLELGAVNVPTSGRFDMDPMTMKMIGVSQRVPVFGWNRLSRRSAGEALKAESAAAELAHYEFFALAWQAYADAFYAGELARQADAHTAVMDRLVKSARARYESGNGRLEDALRAEAERARTLADLAAFRAEERSARARLDALRGVPPGVGGEELSPPPGTSVTWESPAWNEAVGSSHPRLRELEAQVSRYRFAARAARRMALPDLELTASYARRGKLEGGIAQDNMFNATVGLMIPIFASQREFSEGAEMDAMARATEADRRAAELDLLEQLRSGLASAGASQRTVGLLADTVVVTQQRAVEASWSAYSAGTTDLWRVFEATHTLYSEQIALTRARQGLAGAEARLLSITTRGDLLGVHLPEIKRSER